MEKSISKELEDKLISRGERAAHLEKCAEYCLRISNARIAMNESRVIELLDELDVYIRKYSKSLDCGG